jgi:hypothetical protein
MVQLYGASEKKKNRCYFGRRAKRKEIVSLRSQLHVTVDGIVFGISFWRYNNPKTLHLESEETSICFLVQCLQSIRHKKY